MTKAQKSGILQTIINLFVRNWGLKLLALALAILIYHTLKPTDESNRERPNRSSVQHQHP